MNIPSIDSRINELLMGFFAQAKGEAIVVLDPQGIIVGWLGGAENVLGYAPSDVVGKPIAQIFTEEDRANGLHLFELDVARASPQSEDDRWHVRKDGSHIWVTGTVTAVRNAAGDILGFVKVMRDRTDLRTKVETLENRLEAALQKQESVASS